MRLINDFLDSQRYESTGMTIVPQICSSKVLVEDSIGRVAQAAEAKHIRLVTRIDDVELNVDGEQLARVIVNLLHNAIKFSPDESRIQIFAILLTDQHERGPEMEFLVSDGGPGIPVHMQDKIFQKFTQVGTGSAGEKSGSGLGLAICKSIVEAHGGAIGVRSLPGQGSTFWFRIPVQAPAPGFNGEITDARMNNSGVRRNTYDYEERTLS
jgi:signal transduction histidine kinase